MLSSAYVGKLHVVAAFYCFFVVVVKDVKSFPSHKAHRAALISISLALSQTPAYTARPWMRD